ncbi:hypothetical protein BJX70DRAFT_191234 [Aspergillus crustosus]
MALTIESPPILLPIFTLILSLDSNTTHLVRSESNVNFSILYQSTYLSPLPLCQTILQPSLSFSSLHSHPLFT